MKLFFQYWQNEWMNSGLLIISRLLTSYFTRRIKFVAHPMMNTSDLMIILMIIKTLILRSHCKFHQYQLWAAGGNSSKQTLMTSSSNLVSRLGQAELVDELLPGLQLEAQAPPGLGRLPLLAEKRLSWPWWCGGFAEMVLLQSRSLQEGKKGMSGRIFFKKNHAFDTDTVVSITSPPPPPKINK